MRSPLLRETGSIMVRAPRERVYEVLAASFQGEPRLRVEPGERVEAGFSTFVLQDAPGGGTKVIHARSAEATLPQLGPRPREALRAQVELELFDLQHRFD